MSNSEQRPISEIEILDRPVGRIKGINSEATLNFYTSNVKINDLKLDDLDMLSVIVGENGCGKTLLLEKIMDYFESDGETMVRINREPPKKQEYDVAYLDEMLVDGDETQNSIRDLFCIGKVLKLIVDATENFSIIEEFFTKLSEFWNIQPIVLDQRHEDFQRKKNRESTSTTTLSDLENWVRSMIKPVDDNKYRKKIEAFSAGENIRFLLILLDEFRGAIKARLDTFNKPKRVILLDEPDCHMHPTAVKQLIYMFKHVFVKKFNIQVIMTTHSPMTVSLVDSKSLFYMHYDEKSSRSRIVRDLSQTQISLSLAPRFDDLFRYRIVFNEGNDAKFYQCILNQYFNLRENHLRKNFIILISSIPSSEAGNQNCETIKNILKRFKESFQVVDEPPPLTMKKETKNEDKLTTIPISAHEDSELVRVRDLLTESGDDETNNEETLKKKDEYDEDDVDDEDKAAREEPVALLSETESKTISKNLKNFLIKTFSPYAHHHAHQVLETQETINEDALNDPAVLDDRINQTNFNSKLNCYYGIFDNDNKTKNEIYGSDFKNYLPKAFQLCRYSKENYVLDPLNLAELIRIADPNLQISYVKKSEKTTVMIQNVFLGFSDFRFNFLDQIISKGKQSTIASVLNQYDHKNKQKFIHDFSKMLIEELFKKTDKIPADHWRRQQVKLKDYPNLEYHDFYYGFNKFSGLISLINLIYELPRGGGAGDHGDYSKNNPIPAYYHMIRKSKRLEKIDKICVYQKEWKLEEFMKKNEKQLQNIIDAFSDELKEKLLKTFGFSFIGNERLEYPKFILNLKGHDLESMYCIAFNLSKPCDTIEKLMLNVNKASTKFEYLLPNELYFIMARLNEPDDFVVDWTVEEFTSRKEKNKEIAKSTSFINFKHFFKPWCPDCLNFAVRRHVK